MSNITAHPVASIFPMLDDEAHSSLVADIAENGLLEPIWLHEGQIIDGRNRHRACLEAGVEPRYREWDGRGSLVAFVVSLNLHRRHLTSTQCAFVALEILPHLEKEAKERERAGARAAAAVRSQQTPVQGTQIVEYPNDDVGPDVDTREDSFLGGMSPKLRGETTPKPDRNESTAAAEAARLTGTNRQYVADAKKLREERPDLAEKAASGEISMPEAKRAVKADLLEERKRERAKQEAETAPMAASISNTAWEFWLPEQPPCDLLLTDPLYMTDVEDIDAYAASWLPVALDKVKPSGRAYICVGAYPAELRAYLSLKVPDHLTCAQILVWTYRNTLGPTPTYDYKLNWQAILYYRGVDAPPLDSPVMVEQFSVQDLNAPDGRLGDRWHAWQKPDTLAERLIRHSTTPGQRVIDPFAGTGTFLLAAARLGREAAGCELNPQMVEIAHERGCR